MSVIEGIPRSQWGLGVGGDDIVVAGLAFRVARVGDRGAKLNAGSNCDRLDEDAHATGIRIALLPLSRHERRHD